MANKLGSWLGVIVQKHLETLVSLFLATDAWCVKWANGRPGGIALSNAVRDFKTRSALSLFKPIVGTNMPRPPT